DDEPTTWVRAEGGDVDPIQDRGPEALGVAFEMDHNFVPGHEAVGILARVFDTRQLQVRVGCHQAEAVPPAAPALPHPSALEHDVVDPRTLELIARGQSGRTRANNDERRLGDGHGPEYRRSARPCQRLMFHFTSSVSCAGSRRTIPFRSVRT